MKDEAFKNTDFNPQGSREPRPEKILYCFNILKISIHKALASLDGPSRHLPISLVDFNPQGSREPRLALAAFNSAGS